MTVAAVFAASACGSTHQPASPPRAAQAPARTLPAPRTCDGRAGSEAPRSIRDVDWCNRSYAGAGGIPVTLVDGAYEEHVYACEGTPHAGEHTTSRWQVGDVAYGDLDGDGADDAAVLIDEDWFGCGDAATRITRVRVYGLRDGGAVALGETTLGRVHDPLLAALPVLEISGGAVVRTYAWQAGGTCVERWRLGATGLARETPPCT